MKLMNEVRKSLRSMSSSSQKKKRRLKSCHLRAVSVCAAGAARATRASAARSVRCGGAQEVGLVSEPVAQPLQYGVAAVEQQRHVPERHDNRPEHHQDDGEHLRAAAPWSSLGSSLRP